MIKVIKEKDRIYLDYNATTPPAVFLMEEIPKWMQSFGNPSSVHQSSQSSKSLIWKARESMAQFIGCHPLEIIFTSGGSESNNHAIKGLCEKFFNSKRKKIITSTVEHSSVLSAMNWAEEKGFEVVKIPVSKDGILDLKKYQESLDQKTAFVSIMYANNETGCLFPVQELVALAQKEGVLFHCDAVQILGKEPLNIHKLGVDLLTLSGHKFYSLKGCGVLFCKKGLSIPNLILGGPQERKRRAGTENILSICSLGEVAKRGREIIEDYKSVKILRDYMEVEIKKEIPQAKFIGQNTSRLCNSSSIFIPDMFAETVMINLDLKGFSISVSSACHSGSLSPSQVLLGMGYSPQEAGCVLRVSLGLGLEQKEVQKFVSTLKKVVERLQDLPEDHNLDA